MNTMPVWIADPQCPLAAVVVPLAHPARPAREARSRRVLDRLATAGKVP